MLIRCPNKSFLLSTLLSQLLIFAAIGCAEQESKQMKLSAEPEIRICSQNLFNYGQKPSGGKKRKARKKRKYKKSQSEQKKFLLERFKQANCDILAFQEVIGETKRQSAKILNPLVAELGSLQSRQYQTILGNSFDRRIRNAISFDRKKLKLIDSGSLFRIPLPKLLEQESFDSFRRGPVWIEIEVSGVPPASSRKFLVVNFHFKSRYQGYKDPRQTDFEVLRMQMAEATRVWVENKLKARPELIPVLLGDLNSDRDQGASKVLSGELLLSDFFSNCSLKEKFNPSCESPLERKAKFVRVFDYVLDEGFRLSTNYSYRYKREPRLFDEVILLKRDLELAFYRGRPKVDFLGELYSGSDHKLLMLELNW